MQYVQMYALQVLVILLPSTLRIKTAFGQAKVVALCAKLG